MTRTVEDAIHHARAGGKLLIKAKATIESGHEPADWVVEDIKYHHAHIEDIARDVSKEIGQPVSVDQLLEMLMVSQGAQN